MPAVTRAEILKASANNGKVRMEVAPWGGHVYIRRFRANEIGKIQTISKDQQDSSDQSRALAQWCVLGVCDRSGRLMFTDKDIPALLEGPFLPLYECAMKVMEVNGITDEPTKKNYRPTRKGALRSS